MAILGPVAEVAGFVPPKLSLAAAVLFAAGYLFRMWGFEPAWLHDVLGPTAVYPLLALASAAIFRLSQVWQLTKKDLKVGAAFLLAGIICLYTVGLLAKLVQTEIVGVYSADALVAMEGLKPQEKGKSGGLELGGDCQLVLIKENAAGGHLVVLSRISQKFLLDHGALEAGRGKLQLASDGIRLVAEGQTFYPVTSIRELSSGAWVSFRENDSPGSVVPRCANLRGGLPDHNWIFYPNYAGAKAIQHFSGPAGEVNFWVKPIGAVHGIDGEVKDFTYGIVRIGGSVSVNDTVGKVDYEYSGMDLSITWQSPTKGWVAQQAAALDPKFLGGDIEVACLFPRPSAEKASLLIYDQAPKQILIPPATPSK